MKSTKPKIIKLYAVFAGWSKIGKFLIKNSEDLPTEEEVKDYIKKHLHNYLLPEIDLSSPDWILVPSAGWDEWGVWDLRKGNEQALIEWATVSEWDPVTKEFI